MFAQNVIDCHWFHQLNSCWDISVWNKVVDRSTHWLKGWLILPSIKMKWGFITVRESLTDVKTDVIFLEKRPRSFLQAQKQNTFFLNSSMTTNSMQRHLPVLSHRLLCFPSSLQSKYIVSNALISFRCISAWHCVLAPSFILSSRSVWTALHRGRGGFLYHRFTELKIGSSEHENAFDRGGVGLPLPLLHPEPDV